MPRETITEGDAGFYISGRLANDDGPAPLLLGTPVRFKMRPARGQATGPTLDRAAEILDIDTREVGYLWAGDEDTATPGVYIAQFVAVYTLTSQEAFPSDEYIDVIIQAAA